MRIMPRLKVHSEGEKVHVGDPVTLQHVQTGRRLHSHGARYPGGSKQQQVTAFGGADDNDWWLVKGAHGQPMGSGAVPERAIIRLEHVAIHVDELRRGQEGGASGQLSEAHLPPE